VSLVALSSQLLCTSAATNSRAYEQNRTDRSRQHLPHVPHHRHGSQRRTTRAYAAVPLGPHHLLSFLRFAWLRRRSHLCAKEIPSHTVSASAPALALLTALENDIGDLVTFVVFDVPSPRVLPARPEAHGPPAMEATSVVVSWSLVPASRATTAMRFCSRSHFHCQSWFPPGPFVVARAITFRELRQTPAVLIALGQGERRSKFSRRPQRSCSVFGWGSEAHELCIRQFLPGGEAAHRVGVRDGTEKALGLWCRLVPESQISAFPQATMIPGVPSSDMFFQYHLRRPVYHLHLICPEWRICARR